MARQDAETVVTQSVLDRLIDREPKSSAEAPLTRAQSVRQLKASLRRDLEWLLNTRQIAEDVPEAYVELSHSLYNYGLADITALSFSNTKDRTRLLRTLEQTIRIFEPRLMSVRVMPVETAGDGPNRRILRFQIEGLLKMDPAPEQISFDTVLQLTSGEYQVKGDHGA
jgi:type VI secretion system protein ImpF